MSCLLIGATEWGQTTYKCKDNSILWHWHTEHKSEFVGFSSVCCMMSLPTGWWLPIADCRYQISSHQRKARCAYQRSLGAEGGRRGANDQQDAASRDSQIMCCGLWYEGRALDGANRRRRRLRDLICPRSGMAETMTQQAGTRRIFSQLFVLERGER